MEVVATCGHKLAVEEGIGTPCWVYEDGDLSWVVYCKQCKSRLTPFYTSDPYEMMKVLCEKY